MAYIAEYKEIKFDDIEKVLDSKKYDYIYIKNTDKLFNTNYADVVTTFEGELINFIVQFYYRDEDKKLNVMELEELVNTKSKNLAIRMVGLNRFSWDDKENCIKFHLPVVESYDQKDRRVEYKRKK